MSEHIVSASVFCCCFVVAQCRSNSMQRTSIKSAFYVMLVKEEVKLLFGTEWF